MTSRGDDLPVLVIDGANFSDFAGFTREFSRLLDNYTWHGNLDAFNDVLRGGFGTPEGGWILRWLNSNASRVALGYDAAIERLNQLLLTCHPSNRSTIAARIAAAERRDGPTLFDEIVGIIRAHGPGGDESEDGIFLELA
ncbi:barstar family protein [Amycolatopsis sp. VC5-11]|uniref:barstar family protein n=1 Tax=Amycolatopsis sp. VC5-11 TaxID=3120156 RepID=UPI003009772C